MPGAKNQVNRSKQKIYIYIVGMFSPVPGNNIQGQYDQFN